MFSIRNIYTPIDLGEPIYMLLTPALQKQWRQVQTLQRAWGTARDSVAVLEAAADEAAHADAAAAREAAAAGKPIPDATEDAARAAVERARREVTARAEAAHDAEANFMDDLRAAQADLAARALDSVEVQVPKVLDALATATAAVDSLGTIIALYWWAASDMSTTTISGGLTRRGGNGFHESLTSMLDAVADSVREQHPRVVLERQAERDALMLAQSRGLQATADGLVTHPAA